MITQNMVIEFLDWLEKKENAAFRQGTTGSLQYILS